MQLLGAINAYKMMGIDESDLVDVSYGDYASYDGEYVVIPTGIYIGHYRSTKYPLFSDRIIPAFTGLHISDYHCIEGLRRYQHFGPFGCRDTETMKYLRNAGFDAYTSGCMSLIQPRRSETDVNERKKVFFIDAPEELLKHVPDEVLKDADFSLSHNWKSAKSDDLLGTSAESIADVKKIIDKLCKEARLIVTHRVHVSFPYTAMGIPVITALKPTPGNMTDERFSGYSKMLNIYTPDKYSDIDWCPSIPDIEDVKQKVFNSFKNAVTRQYEKYKDVCNSSEYFEEVDKESPDIYYNGDYAAYLTLQDKLDWVYKQNDKMFINSRTLLEHITNKDLPETNVIVFGAGSAARWLIKRFDSYLSRAKSFNIVDNNEARIGHPVSFSDWTIDPIVKASLASKFQNEPIKEPIIINSFLGKKQNLLVIIATGKYYSDASVSIGKQLIEQFGLTEGKEFFFLDKLNNSMNMPLTEEARMYSQFEAL